MHEASLMRGLMRKVLDVATQQGATRVVSLKVRLGMLSHISPEHFKEHFDQAAARTIAEGATIHTEVDTDLQSPTAADVILESVEIT